MIATATPKSTAEAITVTVFVIERAKSHGPIRNLGRPFLFYSALWFSSLTIPIPERTTHTASFVTAVKTITVTAEISDSNNNNSNSQNNSTHVYRALTKGQLFVTLYGGSLWYCATKIIPVSSRTVQRGLPFSSSLSSPTVWG